MSGLKKYTLSQAHEMCDLMDDGHSASEVAAKYGITKGALLGLRNRIGRSAKVSESSMRKKPMKPTKPCLRCGSYTPRDPAMRICDPCKAKECFGGIAAAY